MGSGTSKFDLSGQEGPPRRFWQKRKTTRKRGDRIIGHRISYDLDEISGSNIHLPTPCSGSVSDLSGIAYASTSSVDSEPVPTSTRQVKEPAIGNSIYDNKTQGVVATSHDRNSKTKATESKSKDVAEKIYEGRADESQLPPVLAMSSIESSTRNRFSIRSGSESDADTGQDDVTMRKPSRANVGAGNRISSRRSEPDVYGHRVTMITARVSATLTTDGTQSSISICDMVGDPGNVETTNSDAKYHFDDVDACPIVPRITIETIELQTGDATNKAPGDSSARDESPSTSPDILQDTDSQHLEHLQLPLYLTRSLSNGSSGNDSGQYSSGDCSPSGTSCPSIRQLLPTVPNLCKRSRSSSNAKPKVTPCPWKRVAYMVEVYRPLLARVLQARDILDDLRQVIGEEVHDRIDSKLSSAPRRQLVLELLHAVEQSQIQGKWRTFLEALERSEYVFIKSLLENESETDHHEARELIILLSPHLLNKLDVNTCIDQLFQQQIISESDREEIERVDKSDGPIRATRKLLDLVHRRSPNWDKELSTILNEHGLKDVANLLISEASDTVEEQDDCAGPSGYDRKNAACPNVHNVYSRQISSRGQHNTLIANNQCLEQHTTDVKQHLRIPGIGHNALFDNNQGHCNEPVENARSRSNTPNGDHGATSVPTAIKAFDDANDMTSVKLQSNATSSIEHPTQSAGGLATRGDYDIGQATNPALDNVIDGTQTAGQSNESTDNGVNAPRIGHDIIAINTHSNKANGDVSNGPQDVTSRTLTNSNNLKANGVVLDGYQDAKSRVISSSTNLRDSVLDGNPDAPDALSSTVKTNSTLDDGRGDFVDGSPEHSGSDEANGSKESNGSTESSKNPQPTHAISDEDRALLVRVIDAVYRLESSQNKTQSHLQFIQEEVNSGLNSYNDDLERIRHELCEIKEKVAETIDCMSRYLKPPIACPPQFSADSAYCESEYSVNL